MPKAVGMGGGRVSSATPPVHVVDVHSSSVVKAASAAPLPAEGASGIGAAR